MAEEPKKPTTAEQITSTTNTAAAVANVALTTAPGMCPRLTWDKLPKFSRQDPIILFGIACLPGTETKKGCPAELANYTIAVPVTQLTVPGGTSAAPIRGPTLAGGEYRTWTAPGGNRYWATDIPINARDPKVKVLLRLMAAASRKKFIDTFGKGSNKNLTLAAILAKNEWAARYGIITVEQLPDPNETAADFIRRGGYLLNLNDIIKGGKLDFYASQPWMRKTGVNAVELWGNYLEVAANGPVIGYSIRFVYEGGWDAVRTAIIYFVQDVGKYFCETVQDSRVQAAATQAQQYPPAAPYAAGVGAANEVCNLPWRPPACIPPPPLPGEAPVTYIPVGAADPKLASLNVKNNTIWSQHLQTMTANLAKMIGPGQVPTAPTVYPDGTIAWFDLGAPGYRVATPFPGDGTTHRAMGGAVASLPPEGIRLVDKAAWEQAVLPWLKRGSTKTGLAIGGGVAAAVGLAVLLFRARS